MTLNETEAGLRRALNAAHSLNRHLQAVNAELLEQLEGFATPYEGKDMTSFQFTVSYYVMGQIRKAIAHAKQDA